MISLTTPHDLPVNVPENDSEDVSPKFSCEELSEAMDYYNEHGYVVLMGVFDINDTNKIRELWDDEVKPYKGYIYRQATARAEKHIKNENGWIMNPILNLQSLNASAFPKFRIFATEKILTNENLVFSLRYFIKDDPKIVQSMYFEGNSATWEHQDSYYLDSERVGTMIAAWIALEDISAKAGRFFVCPKSHRIKLKEQDIYTNIAEHHDVYIRQVVDVVKSKNMEIRAPKLNQGDVLLWNAWTIHGSLKSNDPERSRSSITCHVIRNRDKFLQFQTRRLWLAPS